MNIIIYKKQYKDNICGGMTKTEQSSQDIWPPEIMMWIDDSLLAKAWINTCKKQWCSRVLPVRVQVRVQVLTSESESKSESSLAESESKSESSLSESESESSSPYGN